MKKSSNLKIALTYARALYESSDTSKDLDICYKSCAALKKILPSCIDDFTALNNPLWNMQKKLDIIETLGQKFDLPHNIINTLKILVQNRKIDVLPEVINQFMTLYHNAHNIAEIDVTSVVPLTKEQDSLLTRKLATIFSKDVIINYSTNPQIIGGLVIKYGTHFIDASVRSKLNALEKFMKGKQ